MDKIWEICCIGLCVIVFCKCKQFLILILFILSCKKMPTDTKKNSNKDNDTFATLNISTLSISLISGFSSGLVVAFALNPWDKALYLSVINQRSFLDLNNFHKPFQGVTQSLFQRAVSHGLYFPLEHFAHTFSSNHLNLGKSVRSKFKFSNSKFLEFSIFRNNPSENKGELYINMVHIIDINRR